MTIFHTVIITLLLSFLRDILYGQIPKTTILLLSVITSNPHNKYHFVLKCMTILTILFDLGNSCPSPCLMLLSLELCVVFWDITGDTDDCETRGESVELTPFTVAAAVSSQSWLAEGWADSFSVMFSMPDKKLQCKIWDSHGDDNEDCCLLRCYFMQSPGRLTLHRNALFSLPMMETAKFFWNISTLPPHYLIPHSKR